MIARSSLLNEMMSETANGTQNGEAVEREKEMKVEAKAKVSPDAGEKRSVI